MVSILVHVELVTCLFFTNVSYMLLVQVEIKPLGQNSVTPTQDFSKFHLSAQQSANTSADSNSDDLLDLSSPRASVGSGNGKPQGQTDVTYGLCSNIVTMCHWVIMVVC